MQRIPCERRIIFRFSGLPAAAPNRPGDRISCYIKATPKKIAAYEAANLASDFDPRNRDENVDYYVGKLGELVKKFGGVSGGPTAKPTEQESLAFLASVVIAQLRDPHVIA